MARRTGLATLRFFAYRMCNLITSWTPVIKRIYPDNTALFLALDAANVACEVLVTEIDDTIPQGV